MDFKLLLKDIETQREWHRQTNDDEKSDNLYTTTFLERI